MKALHDSLWKYQVLCIVALFMGLSVSVALGANQYPGRTVSGPTENFPQQFSAFAPSVDPSMSVDSKAPQICEWTRQNQPGDTMALTGEALSSFTGDAEGRDTRFVIYGEGFPETDGLIQLLDGQQCTITLPEILPPNEMYLMWPHNAHGFGLPVPINQAELWWLGFDTVSAGDKFYVYGQNLTLGGQSCWLYNETQDEWLESTANTNPYKAEFECPANWANGTHILYAHNGHGGRYGWSEPQSLIVEDKFAWEAGFFNVEDYGADGSDGEDDTDAILAAIEAGRYKGTIYFPAGTYYVSSVLYGFSRTKYIGEDAATTIITPHPDQTDSFSMFLGYSGAHHVYFSDLTFQMGNNPHSGPFGIGGKRWLTFERCVFTDEGSDNKYRHGAPTVDGSDYMIFKDCEFTTRIGANFGHTDNLRVQDCIFNGMDDMTLMASINRSENVDFSGNIAQNLNATDTSDGEGWSRGRWLVTQGSINNVYIGGNETIDLGPRHPTPHFGPAEVTAMGPFSNYHYRAGFGSFGEQEISVASISGDLHDMTPPVRIHYATKALFTWVTGGVTNKATPYIWTIDATNNILTVLKGDDAVYAPFPSDFDSAEFSLQEVVDKNAGEQILLEGCAARFSGYPVSVTSNSMTFAVPADLTHAKRYAARLACVTKGKGLGQTPRIADIDTTTGVVTLEEEWNVMPDTNSLIHLGAFPDQIVIYDNIFDGRPENYSTVPKLATATALVNSYGGVSRLVVDSNQATDLNAGVTFTAEGNGDLYSGNSLMPQIYFNHVEGNTITSGGTGIVVYESANAGPAYDEAVTHIGNVYRRNTVKGMINRAVIFGASSPANKPVAMNVWQSNVFTNNPAPVCVRDAEGVENQVWVDNVFHGHSEQTGYSIAENHVPVLRGNSWIDFNSIYGGNRPGPRIGLPIRYRELSNGATKVEIPVWNRGTDLMDWTVKPLTTALWLSVRTSNTTGVSETDAGKIVISLDDLQPLPTVDSEVILSVSDGVYAQQMIVVYSAKSATISINRTTYSVPLGEFWVEVVDQDTHARQDLGLWYGPCNIPIENIPEAATVIIKKKNTATKAWDLYEEIGKGNRPGVN